MYSVVKHFLARFQPPSSKELFDGRKYWETRAEKHGRRAVLNLAYQEREFEQITTSQKSLLLPLFSKHLRGTERTVLDFGCGPGRFTEDLANAVHGSAVGVDVSEKLIQLARPAPNVTFRVIPDGMVSTDFFEFDAVWICLVLGGIPEPILKTIVERLEAVLKPGGLLFLVENTALKPDGQYWFFRSASEYESMFPLIDLRRISTYADVGEEISIFAGRKTTP